MKRFVPDIILAEYAQRHLHGEFDAFAVFADVSGFTKLTSALQSKGREGAEIISYVLNNIYKPVIDCIYKNNGFISSFAGDAFTALFPYVNKTDMSKIALLLRDIFKSQSIQKTHLGTFNFGVKIGVGYGRVLFRIVENKGKAAYYFYGNAIKAAADMEAACTSGEVKMQNTSAKSMEKSSPPTVHKKLQGIQQKFYTQDVLNFKGYGEFRNVVSVFLSVKEHYVKRVIEHILANAYGGYLNKVDFGDKGYVILVAFGAPIQTEEDIKKALIFSLDIIEQFGDNVRIGLSYGTVYAGIIGSYKRQEYTVLGTSTNLAARLMGAASFGEILVNDSISKNAPPFFQFKTKGALKLKGFKNTINTLSLTGRTMSFILKSENPLYGRKNDILKLMEFAGPFVDFSVCPGVIVIKGEHGIGKTAVIREFLDKLRGKREELHHIYLRFVSRHDPALLVFRNFLQVFFGSDHINIKSRFSNYLAKLKEVSPAVYRELTGKKRFFYYFMGAVTKDDFIQGLDAKTRYNAIIETLKYVFLSYSLLNNAVLIFDNAENMDDQSIELMNRLIGASREFPVLPVVSGKEIPLSAKMQHDILELNLQALKKSDVKRLLEVIAGAKVKREFLNTVFARTRGNPLFIEQIFRFLSDKRLLSVSHGYVEMKGEAEELPGSISSIMVARMDTFHPQLKEAIKHAAVQGVLFDTSILLSTLGVGRKKLLELLDMGGKEHVWYHISDNAYSFTSALLAHAAYDMEMKKHLRKIHRSVAHALENKYKQNTKDHAHLLAYHYSRAEVKTKALYYSTIAAETAQASYENKRALSLYSTALSYIKPGTRKFYEYILKKAGVLRIMGNNDRAVELYKGIAESLDTPRSIRAWALYRGAFAFYLAGNTQKALSYLTEAEGIYKKSRNKKGLAKVYLNLGTFYQNRNAAKSLFYLDKSEKYAAAAHDIDTQAKALGNMGMVYDNMGKAETAKDTFERAVKLLKSPLFKLDRSKGLFHLGITYLKTNNVQQGLDYLKKSLALARQTGDRYGTAQCMMTIGTAYSEMGKWRLASLYFHKAQRAFEELGDSLGTAIIYNNLAELYMHRGMLKKAMTYAKKAINLIDEERFAFYAGIFFETAAQICLNSGDIEGASVFIEREERAISRTGFRSNMLPVIKAKLLYKKGDREKSVNMLQNLIESSDPETALFSQFELFKITEDKILKEALFSKLTSLVRKTGKYIYREMLTEL